MAEGKGGNQGLFSHQVSVTGQNGKLKPSHYLSFHFSFSDTTSMTQIFGAIVKQIWVLQVEHLYHGFSKLVCKAVFLIEKRQHTHKMHFGNLVLRVPSRIWVENTMRFQEICGQTFSNNCDIHYLVVVIFHDNFVGIKIRGRQSKGKNGKKRQNYVFQINLS